MNFILQSPTDQNNFEEIQIENMANGAKLISTSKNKVENNYIKEYGTKTYTPLFTMDPHFR